MFTFIPEYLFHSTHNNSFNLSICMSQMCRSSASTHYDRIVFLSRGGQTFPVRGQIVNILDLAVHVVCGVTTQPCPYSVKTATDNM